MKRIYSAFLVVLFATLAAVPPVSAQNYNPGGDTAPGQVSTAGQSLQTNFPAAIPETRDRGNRRCPNQLIVGGAQTVNDNSNGANPFTNIPSMVLRPFGKYPKDNLDTYLIWATPSTTGSPAARTYTVPDAGANASFVLLQTAQAVAGTLSRADLTAESAVKFVTPILQVRNLDGSAVAAAAAAGKFGISTTATFGSPANVALISEAANTNTKTDACEFEFRLPPEYVAGSTITVNVASNVTGGGTLGATKTLTVDAFLVDDVLGTVGSNLGPAAGTLATGAATNQTFVITPTGLAPGNRLLIQIQAAVQETGGTNINANITGVSVALGSIKG